MVAQQERGDTLDESVGDGFQLLASVRLRIRCVRRIVRLTVNHAEVFASAMIAHRSFPFVAALDAGIKSAELIAWVNSKIVVSHIPAPLCVSVFLTLLLYRKADIVSILFSGLFKRKID